jgi:hypothetical protein
MQRSGPIDASDHGHKNVCIDVIAMDKIALWRNIPVGKMETEL